jgi:hypothetical protein
MAPHLSCRLGRMSGTHSPPARRPKCWSGCMQLSRAGLWVGFSGGHIVRRTSHGLGMETDLSAPPNRRLARERSFALIPSGHWVLRQLSLINSISVYEENAFTSLPPEVEDIRLGTDGTTAMAVRSGCKTLSSWCRIKCWTTVCSSRTGGETMVDQETWESARLIPVSGIKGSDEQEQPGCS